MKKRPPRDHAPHGKRFGDLLPFEEAERIVLASCTRRTGRERVPLSESLGRTLAENVVSKGHHPPFTRSAMDGYALKCRESRGAHRGHPVRFRLGENIEAGRVPSRPVRAGEAFRIMTGAPMPKGADAVVMVEDTEWDAAEVRVFAEVEAGENVRPAGEDVRRGRTVLKAGTVLSSAHIALLALVGRDAVAVSRKPVVAVLSTGNELVDVGRPLGPGKIRDVNGRALCAMIEEAGGRARFLGIARDRRGDIGRRVRAGLSAHILLTTGGVSVGDFDLVGDVLLKMGFRQAFWGIRVKPGKPVSFGKMGKTLVFGLPGNPVSSMVSFEFLVRPAMNRMLRRPSLTRTPVIARASETIQNDSGRLEMVRGVFTLEQGVLRARPTGPQGSGMVSSMALANGFILMRQRSRIRAGEFVQGILVDIPPGITV